MVAKLVKGLSPTIRHEVGGSLDAPTGWWAILVLVVLVGVFSVLGRLVPRVARDVLGKVLLTWILFGLGLTSFAVVIIWVGTGNFLVSSDGKVLGTEAGQFLLGFFAPTVAITALIVKHAQERAKAQELEKRDRELDARERELANLERQNVTERFANAVSQTIDDRQVVAAWKTIEVICSGSGGDAYLESAKAVALNRISEYMFDRCNRRECPEDPSLGADSSLPGHSHTHHRPERALLEVVDFIAHYDPLWHQVLSGELSRSVTLELALLGTSLDMRRIRVPGNETLTIKVNVQGSATLYLPFFSGAVEQNSPGEIILNVSGTGTLTLLRESLEGSMLAEVGKTTVFVTRDKNGGGSLKLKVSANSMANWEFKLQPPCIGVEVSVRNLDGELKIGGSASRKEEVVLSQLSVSVRGSVEGAVVQINQLNVSASGNPPTKSAKLDPKGRSSVKVSGNARIQMAGIKLTKGVLLVSGSLSSSTLQDVEIGDSAILEVKPALGRLILGAVKIAPISGAGTFAIYGSGLTAPAALALSLRANQNSLLLLRDFPLGSTVKVNEPVQDGHQKEVQVGRIDGLEIRISGRPTPGEAVTESEQSPGGAIEFLGNHTTAEVKVIAGLPWSLSTPSVTDQALLAERSYTVRYPPIPEVGIVRNEH